MKVLIKGMESQARIDLLLQLTKVESEDKIKALYDHFCKGSTISAAAALNDVKQPKLAELIAKIERIAVVNEKLFELKTR